MDWSTHFPMFSSGATEQEGESHTVQTNVEASGSLDRPIEIADIGCGFGGLLFALAPKLPETLILGTSLG